MPTDVRHRCFLACHEIQAIALPHNCPRACLSCLQCQFNKLRGVCVAAEQGMRSLLQRLSLALEAPAMRLGPSVPPASAHDAVAAPQQASGAPGSRLTSAGGLSSANGSHGGGDAARRSAAGSSSTGSAKHHRVPSKDHGLEGLSHQSALTSKAQR
jgi:hypothetical protein